MARLSTGWSMSATRNTTPEFHQRDFPRTVLREPCDIGGWQPRWCVMKKGGWHDTRHRLLAVSRTFLAAPFEPAPTRIALANGGLRTSRNRKPTSCPLRRARSSSRTRPERRLQRARETIGEAGCRLFPSSGRPSDHVTMRRNGFGRDRIAACSLPAAGLSAQSRKSTMPCKHIWAKSGAPNRRRCGGCSASSSPGRWTASRQQPANAQYEPACAARDGLANDASQCHESAHQMRVWRQGSENG